MRINVYSQELLLGDLDDHDEEIAVERVVRQTNTGTLYSAVRLYLDSSERLHHPPADDDRSAITFWLPKSAERREKLADQLETLAYLVRTAPPETGMD